VRSATDRRRRTLLDARCGAGGGDRKSRRTSPTAASRIRSPDHGPLLAASFVFERIQPDRRRRRLPWFRVIRCRQDGFVVLVHTVDRRSGRRLDVVRSVVAASLSDLAIEGLGTGRTDIVRWHDSIRRS